MAKDIRFIVLNSDESYAAELRAMLLKFDGVRIVAEVEEAALLNQSVAQFPVDVVMANLDPSPEAVLPIVGEVATTNPNLAVFATSKSTDGMLILKAMRTGVKEFFPKPIDLKTLGEAIEKTASTLGESKSIGRLITVLGTSGGVGATFLATNLAAELAAIAAGHVTVVDLDYRFGQVATLLDVEPTYTMADLCGTAEQLEPSVVGRALSRHASGLQVLSRPLNLAEADTITANACVGVISTLLHMNDYVVADGPMRFDTGAKNILALSDVTILVVQLLVPCVRNALRTIDQMRSSGYNLDRVHLICNRIGRDSGHLSVDAVSETLGLKVFASIPDDWAAASGAINLGEPLISHSPKSKVRTVIQEIAVRLHTPDGASDDKEAPAKKGLIGRIFATS